MANGIRRANGGIGAGNGLFINNGSVSIDHRGTLLANGHITVAATNGVNAMLLNIGTSAVTIDLGPPVYDDQPLRLDVVQGTTAHLVSLGTSVVPATSTGGFTASTTPNTWDYLQLLGHVATGEWAMVAIVNGVTF